MRKISQSKCAIFLAIFISLIMAGNTNAQNAPIGCNAQFYISNGAISGSTSNTALNKLTFSGGTITATPETLNPGNIGFNAMGLNPLDGYIYAIRYPASGAGPRLIKIGSGGTNQVDLGAISNMNNGEIAYSGCFDDNGDFYFTTTDARFMKIVNPVSSRNAIQITGSGFSAIVDIAISPVTGQMYGASTSTGANFLYTINKSTGALSAGYGPNMGGTGFIAGLFFDELGELYGYRSSGSLLLINKSTGAITPVGTAASYSGADGCSCSSGRVFHDLSAPSNICQDSDTTFNITVRVTNRTSTQQAGLKYELTLGYPTAVNRISFTETPAVIAQRLFSKGFLPSNNASQVVISSVSPGTNNKVVVTSFQTLGTNTTDSFTLSLRKLATPATSIGMQSIISLLPAAIGGSDLSNNPNTIDPDDPTIINLPACSQLPVTLVSFTGLYNQGNTLLNWIVSAEINAAYYEIERGTNGLDFLPIGVKNATGNSSITQKYQYTDNLEGINGEIFYYRLKIVDIDAQFKYSGIVLIRKQAITNSAINVIPNPVRASEPITIKYESKENGQINLCVFDLTGRKVARQQNVVSPGTSSIILQNTKNLVPGLYIIRLFTGDEIKTARLLVVQ